MPKKMLKCFVNSVFKDFIPKDAALISTEVSKDDADLVQCSEATRISSAI